MIAERSLTLTADTDVSLDARFAVPERPLAGIAICHPHPLYGGDMDNPVVTRVAEVAAAAGLATIRFNFRGVGTSTGVHGGGTAEHRDLEAALAHLHSVLPENLPLFVAGYSFGSVVAAHVAAAGGVDALALIAPPIGVGDYRKLPDLPAGLPTLVAVGTEDDYCPPPALERLRGEQPAATFRVIDGANHFFFGKLYPLGEAFGAWLAPTLAALQTGQARRRGRAG
jgi:alpha/beta superfamily hydrolase